jgi:hypothetical protein
VAAVTTHLRLRVRQELLDVLSAKAEENSRTLTGEIIARLEKTLSEDAISDMQAQINELKLAVSELKCST